jgi:hypothetical protein
MTDDVDAILGTDQLEEVIEEPPPGQPVVVIQYRTRGLPWYLVIPLLILVPLGAVAFYHNLVTSRSRLRPGLVAPPAPDPGKVKADELAAATKPMPINPFESTPGVLSSPFGGLAGPLSLNTQPLPRGLPTPTLPSTVKEEQPKSTSTTALKGDHGPATTGGKSATAVAPKGAASPAPTPVIKEGATDRLQASSPVDSPSRDTDKGALAVGFTVPADDESPFANFPGSPGSSEAGHSDRQHENLATNQPAPEPAADRQPAPTREQVLDEIRSEAAEKKAELKELRGLKERARDEVAAESLVRIDEQRVEFRRQLDEILRSGSKTAGKEIDELCDRFGRAYDPQLRKRVGYVLSRLNGRMSREAKVKVLRDFGVPEPGVLDFLANELHRYVNSRNGPKDANDVRVNAAKQLLLIKLAKNTDAATAGLQAQQTRPAKAAQAGTARRNPRGSGPE